MNRKLFKIANKLKNHDSILMACSTFNFKETLTLEKGYIMYWTRIYQNGILKEQKYWERYSDAREEFNRYKRDNLKLKYNNYDGGPKNYVHE